MILSVSAAACRHGACLPLACAPPSGLPAHRVNARPLPVLPVGTELLEAGKPVFKVVGRAFFPALEVGHALDCPLLEAMRPFQAEDVRLTLRRTGYALAWITLSDKGYAGLREDRSGPLIAQILNEQFVFSHEQGFLLPDEERDLRALFTDLALRQGYELIIATGGTGLAPRDRSPEAALAVLERRLPGFEHAMTAAGLQKTPTASISRAVAGTLGQSILMCLPGSAKAVEENLRAVAPALKHALDKLLGDSADCGGRYAV